MAKRHKSPPPVDRIYEVLAENDKLDYVVDAESMYKAIMDVFDPYPNGKNITKQVAHAKEDSELVKDLLAKMRREGRGDQLIEKRTAPEVKEFFKEAAKQAEIDRRKSVAQQELQALRQRGGVQVYTTRDGKRVERAVKTAPWTQAEIKWMLDNERKYKQSDLVAQYHKVFPRVYRPNSAIATKRRDLRRKIGTAELKAPTTREKFKKHFPKQVILRKYKDEELRKKKWSEVPLRAAGAGRPSKQDILRLKELDEKQRTFKVKREFLPDESRFRRGDTEDVENEMLELREYSVKGGREGAMVQGVRSRVIEAAPSRAKDAIRIRVPTFIVSQDEYNIY